MRPAWAHVSRLMSSRACHYSMDIQLCHQQCRRNSNRTISHHLNNGSRSDPRHNLGTASDALLFTPGPLTTSVATKQAMLYDLGSRDTTFIDLVRRVRKRIIDIASVNMHEYTCVILQGSGTYGIEGVLTTVIPKRNGKLLIAVNGAYGARMSKIASIHGISHVVVNRPENYAYTADDIQEALDSYPDVTTVAIVHSETTSGIINPIEQIGRVIQRAGKTYIVDAMSSFGGVPMDMSDVDFLVSSSNKCLEGVPGFSFTIARRSKLEAAAGNSRTLSLDLYAQNKRLDQDGQFRFTPPTHALFAMEKALQELDEEGGVLQRNRRYRSMQKILIDGYKAMGFVPYLDAEHQGPIITTFLFNDHLNWDFERFYKLLSDRGFIIYPGVVSAIKSFRIGHIGHLTDANMKDLIQATRNVLVEMKIPIGQRESFC